MQGHDNRLPVPGDGSMDWPSYLPFEKNPHVYNPQQAYIVNWNNRPEHGWRNSDLWWRRWGKAERVDVLIEELEKQDKFTGEDLWNINSRSSFADVNLRYLLPALERSLTGMNSAGSVQTALDALQQWDGYWWDKNEDGFFDGAAPAIMQTWLTFLSAAVLKDDIGDAYFFRFASPGYPTGPVRAAIAVSPGVKIIVNNLHQLNEKRPVDYDFFNGREPGTILVETFKEAVETLVRDYGPDPAEWRLKTCPLVFSAYNFRGVAQTTQNNEMSLPVIMNRGTENNLFVADGDSIQGWDVFAPGQSGFVAPDGSRSPHYSDQMDLYWRFEHKSLPHSRADVRAMQKAELVLRIDQDMRDN